MPSVLPNGIGGNVADELITASPLILSSPARVWYVDSQTGIAGNSGKDRKFPFELIEQAVAAIGANDDHIIVCLSGHTQSTEVGALDQRVSIVGEGATDGMPTVVLQGSVAAGGEVITIDADGVEIRNIRFSGTSGDDESAHLGWISASGATGVRIRGCVFDMDPGMLVDQGVRLGAGCDDWRFESCVWRAVSTTTPPVARPLSGVRIEATLSRLTMDGCTFDGGLHGFDDGSGNPYAFDSAAFVITPLRVLGMTLANGADFKLHQDTVGYVNPQVSTGHAKVEW